MNRIVLPLAVAAAAVTLSGCDQSGQKANEPGAAQSGEAKKAAGEKTIAAGLDQNGRFFQAAKSAGLDATLAGPGPYTVLVPDDAAFAKLPEGTTDSWAKPESRAAADRRPHLSHPAGHGAGRRHRQGDRQRQGQGGPGDHGRRHADRDRARAARSS